jgi:hypothetical protein
MDASTQSNNNDFNLQCTELQILYKYFRKICEMHLTKLSSHLYKESGSLLSTHIESPEHTAAISGEVLEEVKQIALQINLNKYQCQELDKRSSYMPVIIVA